MAAQAKAKKKVRIGGTIDSDLADWLGRTKGKEKFSKHLNAVLRSAMESGTGAQPSLESFQSKLDNILDRVKQLQDKVECIEPGKAAAAPAKRPRGRPRKLVTTDRIKVGGKQIDAVSTGYDVRDDVQWYLSHDRYARSGQTRWSTPSTWWWASWTRARTLPWACSRKATTAATIGVPYPTFRLFYFPLIRDRLLEKKMIEKVDRPGKKGVYKKR